MVLEVAPRLHFSRVLDTEICINIGTALFDVVHLPAPSESCLANFKRAAK